MDLDDYDVNPVAIAPGNIMGNKATNKIKNKIKKDKKIKKNKKADKKNKTDKKSKTYVGTKSKGTKQNSNKDMTCKNKQLLSKITLLPTRCGSALVELNPRLHKT